MDKKIKVYHFNNGSGGGVFSVIRNLLKFSDDPELENHIIYTINKDTTSHFELPAIEGASSQQVFYFSPKWNFYYTCKQLAKLLPDEKAVIVAHDWLELGIVSTLGLQNPVVQFVHGNYDYYYNLAKKHEQCIDRFVTVSFVIYKKLCSILSVRNSSVTYCRFPVPEIKSIKKENQVLKIFYCVRSLVDENKQFKILCLINERLKSKGVPIHWTIVGDGMQKEVVKDLMGQEEGIALFSFLPNEKVIELLPTHDIFILPSLREGFPVTVVEAMKAGVVPLVTNWDGATDELIVDGETGYYFNTGDVDGYADKIAFLNANRKMINQLGESATRKANELFDPYSNTKSIERIITKVYSSETEPKISFKVYGSRLDKVWIPNILTKIIRAISK